MKGAPPRLQRAAQPKNARRAPALFPAIKIASRRARARHSAHPPRGRPPPARGRGAARRPRHAAGAAKPVGGDGGARGGWGVGQDISGSRGRGRRAVARQARRGRRERVGQRRGVSLGDAATRGAPRADLQGKGWTIVWAPRASCLTPFGRAPGSAVGGRAFERRTRRVSSLVPAFNPLYSIHTRHSLTQSTTRDTPSAAASAAPTPAPNAKASTAARSGDAAAGGGRLPSSCMAGGQERAWGGCEKAGVAASRARLAAHAPRLAHSKLHRRATGDAAASASRRSSGARGTPHAPPPPTPRSPSRSKCSSSPMTSMIDRCGRW